MLLRTSYCFRIEPVSHSLEEQISDVADKPFRYINPIGLQHLQWKFYFVYIVILVIECLSIYFLFPETRGPTLEEIAEIFDGEHAAVMMRDEVGKDGIIEIEFASKGMHVT